MYLLNIIYFSQMIRKWVNRIVEYERRPTYNRLVIFMQTNELKEMFIEWIWRPGGDMYM